MEPTIDEVCTTYTWLVRHGYIAFKLVDGPLVVEGEYDGPEDPPPNEPLAREILTIINIRPQTGSSSVTKSSRPFSAAR